MELFKPEGWSIETKVEFAGLGPKKSNREKRKSRKHRQDNKITEILTEAATAQAEEAQAPNAEDAKSVKDPKAKNNKRKNDDSEAPAKVATLSAAPVTKLTPLQQKMMAKLSGSRFRWINEQLYTITSADALKLIKDQPILFDEYHLGFRSQVAQWPENPVDVFVEQLRLRSERPVNAPGGLPGTGKDKQVIIADMGCGEAQLSLDVINMLKNGGKTKKGKGNDKKAFSRKINFKVHSFDLKKANERITVADIRNVPLPDNSCTIVIFCLALMGTNFLDFIKEAFRILAPRGELWIAEIKSRFSDGKGQGDEFVEALKLCGFFHKSTDAENTHFTRFEFFKPSSDVLGERNAKLERKKKFIEVATEKENLEKKRTKNPEGNWLLKPCIYKRR
ncbi:hypothetical protein BABINDRAFT_31079 [Babjeviella inositovora NRRL Y-12698]|uniref:Ribosomal RNA-processing protein 8 n=1 Tax=Babjeviella inositovora NRRL Y-12698 TaxID=984486 RepID=A0A1E3QXG0_9ASCO|nr:uncharacterized protein BABINDRAFT_31079 [Babjeviella inositovora NRRL Y-12698]ODQ82358.1 hypothetical protein BABINDRAFT_31079 [Babjeviella inositovora NRRL Y-12698]